jgi:hypothetical protein
MRKFYTSEVEHLMQLHFNRLSEKEKRHYAAIESQKLSYGGKTYISNLFGICRNRIEKGIKELKTLSLYNEIPLDKQRRPGGGRKKNLH